MRDSVLDYLTQTPTVRDTIHPSTTHGVYAEAVEDVKRTVADMTQAYNAHDWNLYASFLAPSFVYYPQYHSRQPVFRQEYMSRTQDLFKSNPNYKIEVLNQMVMTPDLAEWKNGHKVLSVWENCKQIGNASRGDVVRDCLHILRFEQVHGKWLCISSEGANGCHYFDIGKQC